MEIDIETDQVIHIDMIALRGRLTWQTCATSVQHEAHE